MNKAQWIKYLGNRARKESVEITISDAELFAWLSRVVPEDDPDEVWQALLKSLPEKKQS